MLLLDSYVNQSVVVLKANQDKTSDAFVFFDANRRYLEFRRVSDSSSSRGSLTTKIIASLPVVLPPLPLIKLFDDQVIPIVKRIGSSKIQISSLESLRDALLPRLISGDLRVPDAEKMLEEVGI